MLSSSDDLRRRGRPTSSRGAGTGRQRVALDVDRDGVRDRLDPLDRLAELVDALAPDHLGAQALGVRGQVDRQLVAVEQPGLGVAVAVVGAEPLRAEGLRQRPIEANPWFCTITSTSLMPSDTAVTISWAIIRYDPSPTRA